MASNDSDSSFTAFLLGGMIGAVLGILYAPRSGKETRKMITNMIDEMHEKGADTIAKTKIKAKDIYKEGRDFVETEKDKISSVFEAGKEAYKKK